MKTVSETKFEKVIKDGFQELLKPLGFKKKANNFYLKLDAVGQIINVQKSAWGNKDNISFYINTGVFVPEFWLAYYNFSNKPLPEYPTESECLIRKRIGELSKKNNQYNIESTTDEQQLIIEMRKNLTDFILPYFSRLTNSEEVLHELDNTNMTDVPLGKLITYAEFRQMDKAKIEYERLIKKVPQEFLPTVKEYGQKYRLEK